MIHDSTPRTRLFDLLNEGHELSATEIMERVGVKSDRHVRRLLRGLEEDGIAVRTRWTGRVKKFYIDEQDRILPVRLVPMTEEQILALTVAAEASRAALAPTPLGKSLGNAFTILLREISAYIYSFDSEQEGMHWHFGSPNSAVIDPAIFTSLTRAIQERRRIRIDYFTASTGKSSTGRLIEPYGMAVRNGSWLLVAYCRQKQALRDFSLAAISRLEFCEQEQEYFLRPDDFDLETYFRPRFNALSGDEIHSVRLLVEPDRAEYFHRKSYHPTQQIEEERPDGRIIVSFSVAGLEEMRTFVQGWGVGVTVLEPEVLVNRLRGEAEELARRYGDLYRANRGNCQ